MSERLGFVTRPVPQWRWRRRLQLALGGLWLVDAALQYQPYMFTEAFPRQTIAPTAAGNPGWIAGPVRWAAALLAGHIVILNALFATGQLIIAIGLFWRPTVKIALAASAIWAVLVWWLGEGLGGVLAGPVSALQGLPGAVVLYALIAVLVWPTARTGGSVAETSPLRPLAARLTWLLLWATFAVEALRPQQRSPDALYTLIRSMTANEPHWLSALNGNVASLLAGHGLVGALVLAALCAFTGLSVFVPRLVRAGIVVATLLAAAIWIVGQDFGALATGTATDPNTGPPLLLLAACYWPTHRRAQPNPHITKSTAAPAAAGESSPAPRRPTGGSSS